MADRIPFTPLPNGPIRFMGDRCCVVHIARERAKAMRASWDPRGEALRHAFSGVALAMERGVPDAVCPIIGAHLAEGDLVKRTTEALIVDRSGFLVFLPFQIDAIR